MANKTKKVSIDFDTIPLDDLKDMINQNLLDANENHKYKRTTKTKRQNKQVINFFGSLAYYLDKLPSKD